MRGQTEDPKGNVVRHCVLLYSVTQESEPVRTSSSGLIVEKEKRAVVVESCIIF